MIFIYKLFNNKILYRIKKVSNDLDVNVHEITQKVCARIHDNVKTFELDEFAVLMLL